MHIASALNFTRRHDSWLYNWLFMLYFILVLDLFYNLDFKVFSIVNICMFIRFKLN